VFERFFSFWNAPFHPFRQLSGGAFSISARKPTPSRRAALFCCGQYNRNKAFNATHMFICGQMEKQLEFLKFSKCAYSKLPPKNQRALRPQMNRLDFLSRCLQVKSEEIYWSRFICLNN
jgi:hypothetical protein